MSRPTKGALTQVQWAAFYVGAAVSMLEEARDLLAHVRYVSGAHDSTVVELQRAHRLHGQVQGLAHRSGLTLEWEPEQP
jgi:hypothetical protein